MTEETMENDDLSRLRDAVAAISESIGKMAKNLNAKLDDGERVETKELKELTAAAKELSAVIRGLSPAGDETDTLADGTVMVEFGGEADIWAK